MVSYDWQFIPAGNEPSDCLQAFGDCREDLNENLEKRLNADCIVFGYGVHHS